MITMHSIAKMIAETLDSSIEYKDFCTATIDNNFTYYLNIDPETLEQVPMPYFGVITYNDRDSKENYKGFQTQFLIGIQKDEKPDVSATTIIVDNTLEKLEKVTDKALELVAKEIRTFGINGDTNIRIAFTNKYIPKADGHEDLQMQVDIELEQDKYLTC